MSSERVSAWGLVGFGTGGHDDCEGGERPGGTRQFEAAPDYFLRVAGDSLDKVGFHSGDIVAVRRQPEARNGDIVVARIGSEVTLKRYERVNAHRVELQPVSSNPVHEAIPIGPTTDDAEIVGIVVGAIVGTRRGSE